MFVAELNNRVLAGTVIALAIMTHAGYWRAVVQGAEDAQVGPTPNISSDEDNGVTDPEIETQGSALLFNGRDNYVDTPSLYYDGSHPITLEAAVTPAAKEHTYVILDSEPTAGVFLGISPGGFWFFAARNEKPGLAGWQVASSDGRVVVGRQVHLAGVFDGHTVKLFVDGSCQNITRVFEGNYQKSPSPMRIAANCATPGRTIHHFPGLIHEVRVSNSARYSENFTPAARLVSDPNTMALYHFDENQGNTVHDASGNAHDGTIHGAQWVEANHELPARVLVCETSSGKQAALINSWIADADLEKFTNLESLRRLHLVGRRSAVDAFREHLATVETLYRDREKAEEVELGRLADYRKLEELSAIHCQVTDAGLEHLAELPNLKELWLAGTDVTDNGLVHLRGLRELEVLRLADTKVTGPGIEHLKELANLRELWLNATRVGDEDLKHIQGLSNLRTLALFGTRVTDSGLESLKSLTTLEELRLGNVRVTDAGLEHLKGLSRLKELVLSRTKISDAGLAHLTELEDLRLLYVGDTDVTDAGLASLKALARLEWLGLVKTNVSDAGIKHLEEIPSLCWLNLSGTSITDEGAAELGELSNLEVVFLYNTKVTKDGVQRLRAALPNCIIFY